MLVWNQKKVGGLRERRAGGAMAMHRTPLLECVLLQQSLHPKFLPQKIHFKVFSNGTHKSIECFTNAKSFLPNKFVHYWALVATFPPFILYLKKHKVLIILGDGINKLPRTTITIMLCLNDGFTLPNQVSFRKFCSLNQCFFKEINILPII